jgi:aquaporin Z
VREIFANFKSGPSNMASNMAEKMHGEDVVQEVTFEGTGGQGGQGRTSRSATYVREGDLGRKRGATYTVSPTAETQDQEQRAHAQLVVEFLGTFFLVLVIGLSTAWNGYLAPLAIGATLAVMVYLGGHISGGCYNPAVTLGVYLTGNMPFYRMISYWMVQVGGAVCAASLDAAITKNDSPTLLPQPALDVSEWDAFVGEMLFTAALVHVVLHCACTPKTQGNSYYGYAIGFTVVSGAYALGPLTGCAMNPAVATGFTFANYSASLTASRLWLYWLGPLVGAALAAFVYKLTSVDEPDIVFCEPGLTSKKIAPYLIEFVGTFYLVLEVAMIISQPKIESFQAAIAIGSMLTVMVYAGGYISGGHFNPAVTAAAALSKKISAWAAMWYWVFQIMGGCCGAGIGAYLYSNDAPGAPRPGEYAPVGGSTGDYGREFTDGQALAVEMLFTCALCLVVLQTAATKSQEGNSFFGWAIGSTVLIGVMAIGDVSGCAMNPAVATGLTAVHATQTTDGKSDKLWLYWIGQLLGSLLAAKIFWFTQPAEFPVEAGVQQRPTSNSTAASAEEHHESVMEDLLHCHSLANTRTALAPFMIEFIGSFYLIFTVVLTVSSVSWRAATTGEAQASNFVGLPIGTMLAVMVYMGGHISGGHYNPAVTLGCVLTRKTTIKTGVIYWVCQLAGGLFAAGIGSEIMGYAPAIKPGEGQHVFDAFLLEMLYTLALVLVVLSTACTKANEGKSFFGWAIGSTVMCGVFAIGPLTGCAMNPAVGTALTAMWAVRPHNEDGTHGNNGLLAEEPYEGKYVWIYWVGPLLGAAFAAGLFYITNQDEFDDQHKMRANEMRNSDAENPMRNNSDAGPVNRHRTMTYVRKEYSYDSVLHKVAPYVIEYIGTFFLVLQVTLAVFGAGADPFGSAGLGIGTMLAVMVYMGGHISGGHYNPAVTLGCLLSSQITVQDAVGYWIVQLAGGLTAAAIGHANVVAEGQFINFNGGQFQYSVATAFTLEFLFTFALVAVVLHTACVSDESVKGNSYFGFGIGYVVVIGAYSIGPITGAALNPAVAIAITGVSSLTRDGVDTGRLWIYLVAPMLGGCLAALLFRMTHPEETDDIGEVRMQCVLHPSHCFSSSARSERALSASVLNNPGGVELQETTTNTLSSEVASGVSDI